MFGDYKLNVILDILTHLHFLVILLTILQVKWKKHFLSLTEFLLLLSQKKLEDVKNQIKELYSFSTKMRTIVDKYIDEIFGNDLSHKLCVYTRLGDFGPPKNPRHHPSKKDFTEESTKYVFNEIKKKIHSDEITLVLLGADKKFLTNLNFDGIKVKIG
uniref:Uncharacterized protein n=1 Tax=Meloidogyne enterolobii TaxID=390850 RepID=A0A6V7UDM1_MELEN|nr:unnamed protein product [Meloidogyne enterolobii]